MSIWILNFQYPKKISRIQQRKSKIQTDYSFQPCIILHTFKNKISVVLITVSQAQGTKHVILNEACDSIYFLAEHLVTFDRGHGSTAQNASRCHCSVEAMKSADL